MMELQLFKRLIKSLQARWAKPEPKVAPAPVYRTFDKTGTVSECRRETWYDTDYTILAVQVDDTADGCEPILHFYSYEFDMMSAQLGDRVRVKFTTDVLTSVIRSGHLEAFDVDFDRRASKQKD